MVHRELRNATFEGKKFATSIKSRTLQKTYLQTTSLAGRLAMALARSISARRDVTVFFLKNLLRSVNSRGKELRENTENAPAARMSKEAGFTQFLTHELTPLSSSEFKLP